MAANSDKRTNHKNQSSKLYLTALTGFGKVNKINIVQHIASAFYRKYSDVTPFVTFFPTPK